MKWLLNSPSFEDFLRLLAAWRLWLVGAFLGGLTATLAYFISPPPYRAQATLLVDYNVENVIPRLEYDSNRFYYLQQENDKLIQVAWSDGVLESVSSRTGVPVPDLRAGILNLSQPGDGGWHLMAESPDPQEAASLAAAWAFVFYEALQEGGAGISPVMESSLVQGDDPTVTRSIPMGAYIFFGSLAGAVSLAILTLFFYRKDA